MQEALATTRPARTISSWKTRLLDISLLIIGLVLITLIFGYLRPLARPDAIPMLETAREMLANHNWITPTLNNAIQLEYPPLFYWLTAISFKLFGYTLFAARLWPAIFGIIGVSTLYLFGDWFEGRRMGWACALIATSSMLFLTLMTAASPYLMGSVLLTVGLCSMFVASLSNSASNRAWLATLFWVACALNSLLLGLAGVLLPLLIAVIYFLIMRNNIALKSLFSPRGIAIFLLMVLPWYIIVAKHTPGFLHYFFYESIRLNYLSHFHKGLETFMLILFSAFVALAPWSLLGNLGYWASRATAWDDRFDRPLGTLILVWVSITFIYLIGLAPSSLFWISLLTPAFVLAFAKAVHRWWDVPDHRLFKESRSLLVIMLMLLTAFFCLISRFSSGISFGFATDSYTEKLIWAIYALFLIGGIAAYYALKSEKGLKATAMVFFFTGLIGTIALVSLLPKLRQDSIQPIISYIQTHEQAGDVVANYQQYYPELSFTTHKSPVIMVDWNAVPAYASINQNTISWVVDSGFFWQTMQKNGRKVYFIAPVSSLPALVDTIKKNHLKVVVKTGQTVLLTY